MNSPLIRVIGFALLPALGNIGGGIIAEWLNPSNRVLNRALHLASGVILGVIAVEVMPRALEGAPAWLLALAFLGGGGAHLLIEAGIERWQAGRSGGAGTGAWMTYVAVASDLLGDGLLIGAGSAVSGDIALLLALGQVLADIPEGFAVNANFRNKEVARPRRLLFSASFILPVVGAAVAAYFALRGQGETLKMAGLVFVGGLYTLAAVEDMLSEAHESAEDTRGSAVSFLAGFTLFLLVSDGLS